ncbi:MAG TPA: lipid-A-disaccharide synthase [Xanthobacteraceae bacterium]|nr:lipid-A-disaccharide synthase [Xanthobacteraceae bacterium]
MSQATRTPVAAAAEGRVFLIAAEESGDRLGAALVGALRERSNAPLRFSGVGGRQMSKAGVPSLFPIEELAILGFAEIPRRLPTILTRIRQAADAVLKAAPDVLVVIDSPDFTHRVAKRVRAANPRIPIVDYVCPSVWAWRPWRARAMRRYIDHVLALLPFEPAALQRLGGPPCTYVGHPLAERIDDLRPNREEAQRRLADPPVVLLLPGSRATEIRRMLAVFGEAVARIRGAVGSMELVLPTVPHLREPIEAEVAQWPHPPRIVVDEREKAANFRIARAALAKSGTVTLELALAGVPTVAAYRVSAVEAVVARLMIQVETVILANLVLGEKVVPEFLQEDCNPERLAAALLPLLKNGPERQRQVEAFARLDAIMEIGQRAPAVRAAEAVLGLLRPSERTFADEVSKR